jgi:exodeoxyribonuclease V beta subunit
VFLHEALERVPMESFASPAFADWRARADVSALFDESVAAHGIEGSQRARAEALVWSAYTIPFRLPDGRRIARLADARGLAREMGFVFSVAGAAEPAAAVRGFVRGSIDVAFELLVESAGETRRLTYFVDWKSDVLPSYTPSALERHVNARYDDQAKLYALAIAKLLGSRTREEHDASFGGMVYCFLRGLDEQGNGLWSARPDWDDLARWEGALGAGSRGAVRP